MGFLGWQISRSYSEAPIGGIAPWIKKIVYIHFILPEELKCVRNVNNNKESEFCSRLFKRWSSIKIRASCYMWAPEKLYAPAYDRRNCENDSELFSREKRSFGCVARGQKKVTSLLCHWTSHPIVYYSLLSSCFFFFFLFFLLISPLHILIRNLLFWNPWNSSPRSNGYEIDRKPHEMC